MLILAPEFMRYAANTGSTYTVARIGTKPDIELPGIWPPTCFARPTGSRRLSGGREQDYRNHCYRDHNGDWFSSVPIGILPEPNGAGDGLSLNA